MGIRTLAVIAVLALAMAAQQGNLAPGAGRGPGGAGRGGRGPLSAINVPADDPMTPEKVALGRKLYFDTELSLDRTISCASCHQPEHGYSDGKKLAVGIRGQVGPRHTPSILDAGTGRSFFWDGRASTLEEQALGPLFNPIEMGLNAGELEKRTGLTAPEAAAAIATYVRTLRSQPNRYDWYLAGQYQMLTRMERDGLIVFSGKGGCTACHGGPNLTDDQFHNTGVGAAGGVISDVGRFAYSLDQRDHGAFKTPGLRNVADRAPYMHDGSLGTLEAVVDFYNQGGSRNRFLDPRIRPLRLSDAEKQSLVAFLRALSSNTVEGLN